MNAATATPEKTYGRIDPELQQHAYKKTRKRFCVIVVSTLVLIVAVACLVVGVLSQSRKSHNDGNGDSTSNSGDGNQFSEGSKAILAACNTTLYPELCVKELSAHPNAKPTELVSLAIQVALEHVSKGYDLALKLYNETGINNSNVTKGALQDCVELMEDARDRLNESISELGSLNGTSLKQQLMNIKIWVSGALSYQTVCSDGFYSVSNTNTALLMTGSQEQLSQSIIIAFGLIDTLSRVGEDLSSWKDALLHSARGLRESPSFNQEPAVWQSPSTNQELPAWLNSHDRKLLHLSTTVAISTFPPQTTVAADGSGNFLKIQDAVDKIPETWTGRYTIYIKAGHYPENVVLSKKQQNVMLLGDGIGKTIISGTRNVASGSFTTFRSATVAVTGRGFMAKGISFVNTAGPSGHQAVALRVGGDLSVFEECSFEGYQDTLYALAMRQFYHNCQISGTVDFIFGNAAAIFQNCSIVARKPLPNQMNTLTAQGRKIADDIGGYSFQGCHITSEGNLDGFKNYLGRPWKPYSRTVFIKSNIDGIIDPAGWLAWNTSNPFVDTLYYGEYGNYGPGSGITGRVNWKGVHSALTLAEAQVFTVDKFISGTSWLPASNVEFVNDITI